MDKFTEPSRRFFLRRVALFAGAALTAAPYGKGAVAQQKASKESMKYQDKPNGDKQCATCMQFIPGKNPKALGGCKIFPGDTEISPQGYCVAWVAKPK